MTDFNPLTIWFFDECYVRFSAEKYDVSNLSNRFKHLTNNSIAKYSSNFDQSEIPGNMWFEKEFSDYLKYRNNNLEIFEQSIKPKMKQIVKWSLASVQDVLENRKNSHELFGYDFMIDDHYDVWLIEVNSSPAMDYSTVRIL